MAFCTHFDGDNISSFANILYFTRCPTSLKISNREVEMRRPLYTAKNFQLVFCGNSVNTSMQEEGS